MGMSRPPTYWQQSACWAARTIGIFGIRSATSCFLGRHTGSEGGRLYGEGKVIGRRVIVAHDSDTDHFADGAVGLEQLRGWIEFRPKANSGSVTPIARRPPGAIITRPWPTRRSDEVSVSAGCVSRVRSVTLRRAPTGCGAVLNSCGCVRSSTGGDGGRKGLRVELSMLSARGATVPRLLLNTATK